MWGCDLKRLAAVDGHLPWTDVTYAVVVGPSMWWGRDRGGVAEHVGVAGLMLSGLIVTLVAHRQTTSALVVAAVSVSVFVVPPVVWSLTGHWLLPQVPLLLLPLRLAAIIAGVIAFDGDAEKVVFVAVMGGLCLGFDAALSCGAIGINIALRNIVRRFLVSGVHLGVVVGLALSVAFNPDETASRALGRYGLFLLALAAVLGAVGWLQRLRRLIDEALQSTADAIRAVERRLRAHWIHDDVSAELRLVRIQLETGRLDAAGVGIALSQLDHRLRLRQLDESLAAGRVRVTEVLQPFVRVLQDCGVEVLDVPTFYEAQSEIDPSTAYTLRRSLAVLVNNSIQAGASQVGISCATSDGHLVLRVEDDAGGFDLDRAPAGRGLDSLASEVGRDHLSVVRTTSGAVVTVEIDWSGTS